MDRREIGQAGEKIVGAYLARRGYCVVQYNYHGGRDEIDLIAANQSYLAFVEVKTRKAGAMVSGLEAVTSEKRKRIIRCAERFLCSEEGKKFQALQPRFDVAQVTVISGSPCCDDVEYIENAFGVE